MQLTKTKQALEAFKTFVVRKARHNLSKQRKRVSKDLYNSIDGVVEAKNNWIAVDFEMEDYGVFQDKGVSGTKKKYNTPFSYKSSSNLVGLEYHTGSLAKWAKAKQMRPRDKNGRYGTYKSMGFILANTIKKKGIKPSLFFTKPFEKAFKSLPNELIEQFGLDVEGFLAFTLNNDRLK